MAGIPLAVLAILAFSPNRMNSDTLDQICSDAGKRAVAKFADAKVLPEEIGISIAVLNRDSLSYETGGYRDREPMYPASIVKFFYLVHLMHQLEQGEVKMTDELRRGTTDMIKDSSNDATGYILDVLTKTTGGPELSGEELKAWMDKRNAVNRWYESLGYSGINVNQKTWNEGPYGRERQGYGPKFELRNSLHPAACTRLFAEVALGKVVTEGRCQEMLGYLSRPIIADDPKADFQSRAFIGKALPSGYKLWSKAGYVTAERHDTAYVKSPDGRELVISVFTKNHTQTPDLIPFIASEILKELKMPAVETISETEIEG
jgi:beta-lactamase class A